MIDATVATAAAQRSLSNGDWIAIGTAVVAIAAAIFGYFGTRISRRALHRDLASEPVIRNPPRDAEELPERCVKSRQSKDGLERLEPFILRPDTSELLDDVPMRLVLVGRSGIGKSRFAYELVKRLQRNTANRSICFSQRSVPVDSPLKALGETTPHHSIVFIDDVQPGAAGNHDFAKHFSGLIERLSKESGRHPDSINVILTIWPEYVEWLSAELSALGGYRFVNMDSPTDDEKERYVQGIISLFHPLTLESGANHELIQSSTYGELFETIRRIHNHGIERPTAGDVSKCRSETWEDELKSFPRRERLLLMVLTALYQFNLDRNSRAVWALYSLAARGAAGGRLCYSGETTFSRRAPRRWAAMVFSRIRPLLLRFAAYGQYEFRKAIESLVAKNYVKTPQDLITSDKESVLALNPGEGSYHEELTATVKAFEAACLAGDPLAAREGWVPWLVDIGELLFKLAQYNESIDLDKWLFALDEERIPRPDGKPVCIFYSTLLHFIGFNSWNRDKDPFTAAYYYSQAVASDPENVKAMHALANVYRAWGRNYDAFSLYRKIIGLRPDDWITHKTLLELYLEFHLSRRVNWSDAVDSYERLKVFYTSGPEPGIAASIGVVLARVDAAAILWASPPLSEAERNARCASVDSLFQRAIAQSRPNNLAASKLYYGIFLYEVLREQDKGISELEDALTCLSKVYPGMKRAHELISRQIVRKLIACYEEQAEARPAEASSFERRITEVVGTSREVRVSRFYAALRTERRGLWKRLPRDKFWPEVERMSKALSDCLTHGAGTSELLQDARIHEALGDLLWCADRIAKRRNLLPGRPAELGKPRDRFADCLGVCEKISQEEDGVRSRAIEKAKYILKLYDALGSGQRVPFPEVDEDGDEQMVDSAADGLGFLGRRSRLYSGIARLLIKAEFQEAAICVLEASVAEHPRNWGERWLMGRAYEECYRLREAFDSFWASAEGLDNTLSFAYLRSIVDGWREPIALDPPFRLGAVPECLRWDYEEHGYKFKVFQSEIPNGEAYPAGADDDTVEWLGDVFHQCAMLKAGIMGAGWNEAAVRELMVRCSRRVYELDPEGKLKLRNLTDYAYDLMENGELSQARAIFEEECRLATERGLRPYFSMWFIGECIRRSRGLLDLESSSYFIKSAVLEGYVKPSAYNPLKGKLESYPGGGEELGSLCLRIYEEDPQYESGLLIENIVPVCLDGIWENKSILSEAMLDKFVRFERDHPIREAAELAAVAFQRNKKNVQALFYFEKLPDLNSIPLYVLISYWWCLRRLGHNRSDEVSDVLRSRQGQQEVARDTGHARIRSRSQVKPELRTDEDAKLRSAEF